MSKTPLFKVTASLGSGLSYISNLVDRLVSAACFILVYTMLGLLLTQVVMRYFFGSPPSWTEELAIILFTWLVLLFASSGIKHKFHVALDTIPQRMQRLRKHSDALVSLLIILVGLVMIKAGYAYVIATQAQKTAALQIPIAYLYASVPISGAIIVLHSLNNLFADDQNARLNATALAEDLVK
ncbi:MAG: TRAP transporter small permease [Saccharospirillum sp.]